MTATSEAGDHALEQVAHGLGALHAAGGAVTGRRRGLGAAAERRGACGDAADPSREHASPARATSRSTRRWQHPAHDQAEQQQAEERQSACRHAVGEVGQLVLSVHVVDLLADLLVGRRTGRSLERNMAPSMSGRTPLDPVAGRGIARRSPGPDPPLDVADRVERPHDVNTVEALLLLGGSRCCSSS